MITDPLAQLFLIVAVVHVALLLQERFAVFRSMGAALVVVVAGMALSNSGILPGQSPVYDFMTGTGVNIAVLLILLSVDIQSVRQAGPRMLAAFGIGALGSVVGSIIAGFVFATQIGLETWKLTGMFAGTYIGGGVNFAALAQAFDTSSDLFTAGVASDVILMAVWLAVTLSVPVIMRRGKGSKPVEATAHDNVSKPVTTGLSLSDSGRPVALRHLAGLGAYVLGALWLSQLLGEMVPVVPTVVWLSSVALIAAQIHVLRTLPGGAMVGNYVLLLFMTSNGARSVAAHIIQVGPSIFYLATLALLIHGVVIFGVGRLLKLDLATLAIASQAGIGGAATAVAVATGLRRTELLLPGVAVALLGYAVGNYVGVLVGFLARPLLAG